jgi:hypothetical protein
MKRVIECLEIKGYKINYDINSDLPNSVFYDKEDDSESYIQVIEDFNDKGFIFLYIQDASIIRAAIFTDSSVAYDLSKFAETNLPESMR